MIASIGLTALFWLSVAATLQAQSYKAPRTADGKPDLHKCVEFAEPVIWGPLRKKPSQ